MWRLDAICLIQLAMLIDTDAPLTTLTEFLKELSPLTAGGAADKVRVCRKLKNGKPDRPDNSAECAARADRVIK